MSILSEQQPKTSSSDADLGYWNERWQENQIGFHRRGVNELFKKHVLSKLIASQEQQCVAFNLCGKSVDMMAVLDAGHRVIGIDGCSPAIEAFFKENQIPYELETDENAQCSIYKGTDHPVTIYCTDFFNFNQPLSRIDYVWDRAALIAIDPVNRERYRDSIYRLMTPGHTQLLLVTLKYDDPNVFGPPHSVSYEEMTGLFRSECSIERADVRDSTEDYNSQPYSVCRINFVEESVYSIVRKQ